MNKKRRIRSDDQRKAMFANIFGGVNKSNTKPPKVKGVGKIKNFDVSGAEVKQTGLSWTPSTKNKGGRPKVEKAEVSNMSMDGGTADGQEQEESPQVNLGEVYDNVSSEDKKVVVDYVTSSETEKHLQEALGAGEDYKKNSHLSLALAELEKMEKNSETKNVHAVIKKSIDEKKPEKKHAMITEAIVILKKTNKGTRVKNKESKIRKKSEKYTIYKGESP